MNNQEQDTVIMGVIIENHGMCIKHSEGTLPMVWLDPYISEGVRVGLEITIVEEGYVPDVLKAAFNRDDKVREYFMFGEVRVIEGYYHIEHFNLTLLFRDNIGGSISMKNRIVAPKDFKL